MAHLAIAPWPEHGHLVASFGLARPLVRAGHRVTYFVPPACVAAVRDAGFDARTILDGERARNATAGVADFARGGGLGARLRQRQHALAWFDAVAAEPLGRALREAGCTLLLADRLLPLAVLHALGAGLDAATYATDLGPLPAGGEGLSRATRRRLVRLFGLPDWQRRYGEAARALGVDPARLDHDAPGAPRVVGLPHALLAPRELEIDPDPRASYVACLDDGVAPASAPPAHRRRRLVVCAFGTQVHRYGAAPLYRAFVEAMAALPDVDARVALGALPAATLPANVQASLFLPQRELLGEADLMVTHGGFNSIKECLFAGVPMLVTPFAFDQPANAARVAHHGLGRALDPAVADAHALGDAIAALLDDGATRARVSSMRARFVRRLAGDEPTAWVAAILDGTRKAA